MRTVFLFEWKKLFRTPISLLLLFFFLVLGLYSVFYGERVIRTQRTTIDSLQISYSALIKSSIEKFRADTATRQGQIDYNNVSSPSSVNYLIKPSAIFFPNAFSALAIGQRDVLPFYKSISTEKSYTQAYEPDIANPEVLIEGNFDLSFVIIYLLPLLMIALSYNVIAQEREDGTLPMLYSQSIRPGRLLFYKLLFRAMLVCLVTFFINAVAILCSSITFPVGFNDIASWCLVVGSYSFLWFAICYLLVSLHKNSVTTAFYLSGCWMVLTIILPGILNFYIEMTHPLGIRADMASQQREIEEEVWEIKPKALIWNFYARHPQYKTGNLADTLQYSPRRFAAYYDELERRLSPVAAVYNDRINERNSLMSALSDFVPTLKTQKMLNQIGASDRESFNQFDQSALQFQQQWQAFIYHFIFNDRNLRANDYQMLPAYKNPDDSDKHRVIMTGAMQLLLAACFLIFLRFYIAKKLKHINN